jgi:hypothetical protein
MQQTMESVPAPVRRSVRFVDVDVDDAASVANGIEDLYDDRLDAIIVRRAFSPELLAETGRMLDSDDSDRPWARPNEKMPVEDVQLLGTDTPATPTYAAPRGGSLEDYLAGAAKFRPAMEQAFDSSFVPGDEFQRVLEKFAGGRPAEVPLSADGRSYLPATLRRLVDGKQIGIHHDYHYRLAMYEELVQKVDTTTLVSFVATLQAPDAGGELFVYGVTPDTPGAPKMPNGFQWDLAAIEAQYDFAKFDVGAGDLFLIASGRCLHRVAKIEGPHARVTMGGFLALDKDRQRVLFWS